MQLFDGSNMLQSLEAKYKFWWYGSKSLEAKYKFWCYNPCWLKLISHGTVFFSPNKSANNIFQSDFSARRTKQYTLKANIESHRALSDLGHKHNLYETAILLPQEPQTHTISFCWALATHTHIA